MSHVKLPELRAVPYGEWRELEAAHYARVAHATAGHRERRLAGQKHAIEDFLFTYYPFTVAALHRWHPGAGVALLADAGDVTSLGDRAEWRWYTVVETPDGPALTVSLPDFLRDRASGVTWINRVLHNTLAQTPRLGCFGLHEWAMVYGLKPGEQRHENLPLRLTHSETDQVVETQRITCTHFDAFRFFTEPARPLNLLQPTRASQADLEQPGCLHAGMDLYKWATKLVPAIRSELLMSAFDLALDIRLVDMQASPYDVSGYGHEPIRIETPSGRAEYARRQADFARRGNALRVEMLAQPIFAVRD